MFIRSLLYLCMNENYLLCVLISNYLLRDHIRQQITLDMENLTSVARLF